VIADMTRFAVEMDDLAFWAGGVGRAVEPPAVPDEEWRRSHWWVGIEPFPGSRRQCALRQVRGETCLSWGKAGREFLPELARRAPLLPGAETLAFIDVDSM
jgi:hypothetical protein